jgi:hypothetical protein
MNIHYKSPLGQLERMFDCPICILCAKLGGLNTKPSNKPFCSYHISRPPEGFKCKNKETNCRYKSDKEGNCIYCSIELEPYWSRIPEGLEFLDGKKRLPKYLYAHIIQGRGKERGLETLDRIGEVLEIGNGTNILNCIDTLEEVWKVLRKEL